MTTVTTPEELQQIHMLNQQNLREHLNPQEQEQEGFVSWSYSIELLERLHQLAPSIIVKDEDRVVAYAVTVFPNAHTFHRDLEEMLTNLQTVKYKGRSLFDYRFYCMGQICVDKPYRGKGLISLLYNKHKKVYGRQFELLLTEIATRNQRSQKTHEKVGFQTIYTHTDSVDNWKVVVWEW